ncbi:replication initiator protein A [Candidatus Igneacidithiobacillus taiwanensis]|uniref:replication initiator protein A n=1 Tax=Candidatus Igneacidithiobacillus taiwanensis TaxID=1945924 RepID=UPI002896F9F0|nr:replication initiator protein A [Candidatus Igneacidithiobacillus taiwanensis]
MPRKFEKPKTSKGQPSLFDDLETSQGAGTSIVSVKDEVPNLLDSRKTPSESPENAFRQRIERLREHHRVLSDLIVITNRDLARHVFNASGIETDEVRNLLARLDVLQQQRASIEAEEQEEIKSLQALKHRLARVPYARDKSGLVKVRHPNRDFFLADLFDYAMKDDGASMEAPIFTLSTKPDLSIWEWRSKDGSKYVKVAPSVLGRATQHDKDVLIYVVSQLVEGLNRGRDDAKYRTVRFTVYDFLVTTNRDTSGAGYQRLHEAFERLRGTTIATDIRTGSTRVREGFGIIDRWKIIEKSSTDERMVAVEVTLSEWLYNAVQAFEVLTIHPDYFRLRKPLARRLYEIARKHCGHQKQWTISLELLQKKAGSKSSLREFRRAVRAIQEDNSLPEYHFVLGHDDNVTFYASNTKRVMHSLARAIEERST